MSHKDTDAAQLMALAAWTLRGLLHESQYGSDGDLWEGRDDDNPPLTIRGADGELLHLRQGPDGQPVMVDDQADAVTPIDPEDMEDSIIRALRAADKRAVDRLHERLCEIADTHEHAARTSSGIVLFSQEGKRLCDWSAGTDWETGRLRVFCQPVGGYQPKTGHWSLSSCRSLDGWLKALAAEFDSPGTR